MTHSLLALHIVSGLASLASAGWYFFSMDNALWLKFSLIAAHTFLGLTGVVLFLNGADGVRMCVSAGAYMVFLGVGTVLARKKRLTGCPYLDGLET